MKIPHGFDPFRFTTVTAPDMCSGYPGFFDNEFYRDIEPVNKFWLNVRGSPRNRRGKMYAKRFGPWALLLWVREEDISGVPYWAASHLVLEGSEVINFETQVGKDGSDVKDDAMWDAWVALQNHLEYITDVLNSLLLGE